MFWYNIKAKRRGAISLKVCSMAYSTSSLNVNFFNDTKMYFNKVQKFMWSLIINFILQFLKKIILFIICKRQLKGPKISCSLER
jgi:esterase/lipase superfamily enzyme